MDHGQLSPPTPAPLSRASSMGESMRGRKNSVLGGLKMSKMDNEASNVAEDLERSSSRKPSLSGGISGILKMTSISSDDTSPSMIFSSKSRSPSVSTATRPVAAGNEPSDLTNESAIDDSDDDGVTDKLTSYETNPTISTSPLPPTPILLSPSEISAQLPTSLAALRRSSLLAALRASEDGSAWSSRSTSITPASPTPAPILLNSLCSGYFLEPVSDS